MAKTYTISKTFVDTDGTESVYSFSLNSDDEASAIAALCAYATAIEYGALLDKWVPSDMLFTYEDLYQFIQPQNLANIVQMNPTVVERSYASALAYVRSFIGSAYDIDTITESDTTAAAQTLRLALCLSTSIFILGSAMQFSEVTQTWNIQLQDMLNGLRRGGRNMGKNLGHRAVASVVNLGLNNR